MKEFICSVDLWSNIIGGVVAAALVSLSAFLWDRRRQRILNQLTEIMGRAIKHRNIGEKRNFPIESSWLEEAKAIEADAYAKADSLSPSAGALIRWLDRVPPWNVSSEVDRYVSILSKVIERIRELLERSS